MKFLNPVFLPMLFILTVAATPLVGPNRRAKRSKASGINLLAFVCDSVFALTDGTRSSNDVK
jgi:hypothetical protein